MGEQVQDEYFSSFFFSLSSLFLGLGRFSRTWLISMSVSLLTYGLGSIGLCKSSESAYVDGRAWLLLFSISIFSCQQPAAGVALYCVMMRRWRFGCRRGCGGVTVKWILWRTLLVTFRLLV